MVQTALSLSRLAHESESCAATTRIFAGTLFCFILHLDTLIENLEDSLIYAFKGHSA